MRNSTAYLPHPKDASWTQLAELPFRAWRDVYSQIAGQIASEAPETLPGFSTWFATMPVLGVFQHGNQVCIQYHCANLHRKQEVEKLQPMLERLLAAQAFEGRAVTIELVCEEPQPSARAAGDGQPLPAAQVKPDRAALDHYRRQVGIEISDDELLSAVKAVKNAGYQRADTPAARPAGLGAADTDLARSMAGLDQILVEPEYATTYDAIIRSHSAVYLPAYFIRHLRHMGAADGLRFLALRQIAYKQGLKDRSGQQLLPAALKELTRWSTLAERNFPGNLAEPSSYLHLLAGRVSFYDYYQSLPAGMRWEDAGGYHWKTKDREFCVWKTAGQPGETCSQRITDPRTDDAQWRKAPAVYRVQLSMPLCPEDAATLREVLVGFGVQSDPLGAIRQCLALSRDELIPDRPQKLAMLPDKLYTVQELVLETWGCAGERGLAAQVAAQAKLLEGHLLQPATQLLKIPFYLLEKWGTRLSPAQLWTVIILMDRVYADSGKGEYRDTTLIKNGIKEIMLWTDDEYTKGGSRKVAKWLYPFNALFNREPDEPGTGQAFNAWFSVFAAELLPERGARVKNLDNSVQLKLRVLPMVPLTPEDTLEFAHSLGCTRMLARDAGGKLLGLEITPEELAVYLPGGRTLRYSHSGELRHGETAPVLLRATSKNLDGLELRSSALFYELENWSGALFHVLENNPGALLGDLENEPGALSCGSGSSSGALICELALDPGALFCVLLKLLILNLYGIKNNSSQNEAPIIDNLSENIDPLDQFGSRSGQFIQWTVEQSNNAWEFLRVAKGLGITDIQSLQAARVTPTALIACALELYATPAEKFTTGRVAVLVARLRKDPRACDGAYLRLAELGPEPLQSCLRRAIIGMGQRSGDPDWDAAMARARRDDLIELAEKLALGRVLRA